MHANLRQRIRQKAISDTIILLVLFASIIEWSFIEDLWIAIIAVTATVFLSSFLFLKVSHINASIPEYVKNLLKIAALFFIFISPVILYGRSIVEGSVANPYITAVAIMLTSFFLFALYDVGMELMEKRSPPTLMVREPEPEILDALEQSDTVIEQLERETGVHIDLYLDELGIDVYAVKAGPKRLDVFMPKEVLLSLDKRELMAVLAHEIAHLQMNHPVWESFTIPFYFGALLTSILLLLHAGVRLLDALIMASGIVFFIDITLTRPLSRKHEYEADLFAARIVGKDAMISALEKMRELININKTIWKFSEKYNDILGDYPSIESRIKRLQSYGYPAWGKRY